jgi:hypothetical protein
VLAVVSVGVCGACMMMGAGAILAGHTARCVPPSAKCCDAVGGCWDSRHKGASECMSRLAMGDKSVCMLYCESLVELRCRACAIYESEER